MSGIKGLALVVGIEWRDGRCQVTMVEDVNKMLNEIS